MFAVIYRGYIKPGKEAEYLCHWKTVATYFVEECGALGSTLHETDEGMILAYSRWPNKATRDACWPQKGERINPKFPFFVVEAIEGIKSCLDDTRALPEICMEVKETVS